MRERQAALIGAVLAVILLSSEPACGQKDAATQAQEGDINHWIEYYRKKPEPAATAAPTRPSRVASEEEREKRKEERGKSESEGE